MTQKSIPNHLTEQNQLDSKLITKKSKSNFALSFAFLPKDQAQAITDFYAFCRVVDDAVDDNPPQEATRLLKFWKTEIELCYASKPTHPVTLALQNTIQKFHIPQEYPLLLLEGCEMDLHKNRYASLKELEAYCYRVASIIGLTCMNIFGLSNPLAQEAAIELGMALQLTNIIRDVKVDAQLGRIYLPQEDMKLYRLSEEKVLAGPINNKIQLLLKLQAERAETYFQRAFTKMKKLPRRPLIAAWIMGKVYYQLLKKIRKHNFDIYPKVIRISRPHKALIALREYFRILFSSSH